MTGAAWHRDPAGRHELRWWDGSLWTEHVSDHGVAGIDPLPPAAPPTVATPVVTPGTTPAAIGSAGAARTGDHRTVWVWIGVATVAAIGLGAGIVVTMRDGDGGRDVATETTDEEEREDSDDSEATTVAVTLPGATTTVPATSMSPATVPATVAPTTAAATTVAPTEPPTTIPPTTVPHVATTDDLVAALPLDTELPTGWSNSLQTPITNPAPSTSPHDAVCGLTDDVARAQAHGTTAIVWGPSYWTLPDGWAGVDLYAFPTEADASAFLADSLAAAQACDHWTYTMLEGDGPDQFDGFEDYGDGVVVWSFDDKIGAATAAAADTPEAIHVLVSSFYSTIDAGDQYAATITRAMQYERHGRVVTIVYSDGACCMTGYGDVDPALDTTPTLEDVAAAADVLRPGIVSRLTTSGAI